jgi:hypothetical protein
MFGTLRGLPLPFSNGFTAPGNSGEWMSVRSRIKLASFILEEEEEEQAVLDSFLSDSPNSWGSRGIWASKAFKLEVRTTEVSLLVVGCRVAVVIG